MRTAIFASMTAALLLPALAGAQQNLATVQVVSGLTRPVFVTAPPGDTSRIFVIEQRAGTPQTGRIRIINLPSNTLNTTPYLTTPAVATGNEQGLLGLAFHPNFAQNGYFYVDYDEPAVSGVSAGSTVIVEYRATGGNPGAATADPASARVLLRIPQPDANHNGGWIAFGPDGYLYIAMGDGGCGNDTNCTTNPVTVDPPGHTAGTGNAQDITDNLLGKILRIDVDGADNIPNSGDEDGFPADPNKNYQIPPGNPFIGVTGDDEIWLYGLRNPWRDSFDPATGELWIADVGQNAREEIDVIPAGAAGYNMGWRCTEGTRCTGLSGCTCNGAGLVPPILEYGHTAATAIGPTTILGCAITGGYVYRGAAIPCFRGHYIFADYCSGDIWSFRYSGGQVVDLVNRTAEMHPSGTTIDNITSFGTDAAGELYICDQTGGQVFKIVPGGFTGPDCNANGLPDSCDIAMGTSTDANGNGIPDECEQACNMDYNSDGGADVSDIFDLANDVAAGTSSFPPNSPDFNNDGAADIGDVLDLANAIASGQCP